MKQATNPMLIKLMMSFLSHSCTGVDRHFQSTFDGTVRIAVVVRYNYSYTLSQVLVDPPARPRPLGHLQHSKIQEH